MGIQGLLPVLKNVTQTVHVSKYKGHKVAVDAYCWLHRAAYCCSEEICEGQYTDKYGLPSALVSQPKQPVTDATSLAGMWSFVCKRCKCSSTVE